MLKKLFLKICWYFGRHTRIHLVNRNLSELNYRQILSNQKYQDNKNLINYGFKVYSQNDEDGILNEIFNRIGIKNKTFIEFGVEDGKECNTTFLLKQNWGGVWVDMTSNEIELKKNFKEYINNKLFFKKIKITKKNVNEIIKESLNKLKTNELDLLSIDLSRNTYHILKSISDCNPRVVVAEYNAKLRDKTEWVCPYDENKLWDKSDKFSASLKSFEIMMKQKNYFLVCCNITGINAFFLRKDLINDKFIDNFSSEFHYEEFKNWLSKKFENEFKISI